VRIIPPTGPRRQEEKQRIFGDERINPTITRAVEISSLWLQEDGNFCRVVAKECDKENRR
jgi:hypothetical protein